MISDDKQQGNNGAAISILIRTFNSAKILEKVLSKLTFQNGDECIVVDSGSSDKTLSVAEKYRAKIVRAQGRFNYSRSLNLGFEAAVNSWVLVMSSHSIPMVPDLLGLYRDKIRQFPASLAVAYGPSTLSGKCHLKDFDESTIWYFDQSPHREVLEMCGNGNTLYRKEVWQKAGFDEQLLTAEDRVWLAMILDKGYKVAFIPYASCLNANQGSIIYMFCKGYNEIRAVPHQPMSLWSLGLAIGQLIKRKIYWNISWGNFIRHLFHAYGRFFGSWRSQKNEARN